MSFGESSLLYLQHTTPWLTVTLKPNPPGILTLQHFTNHEQWFGYKNTKVAVTNLVFEQITERNLGLI